MIGEDTVYRTDPNGRAMAIINKLEPEARKAALAALIELTRPLTARDVDLAFAKMNVSRSKRRPLIRAMFDAVDVVLVVPRR